MPNPITKRLAFWKDIYYGKVRVGVAGFITLSTIILSIRDLFIAPERKDFSFFKYIPQWPWSMWMILGLLGLLFLTLESSYSKYQRDRMSFRAAYRARRKDHKAELATSRLHALIPQSVQNTRLATPQATEPEVEKHGPNLVYINPRFPTEAARFMDVIMPGLADESYLQKWNRLALVVRYENQPTSERKVGPIDNISAIITFKNDSLIYQPRVNRGAWLTSQGETVQFRVNDNHMLVIAVLAENDNHKVEARTVERTGRTDREEFLYFGSYLVQVQLVAEKAGGEIIKTFQHKLEITDKKHSIDPVEL